MSSGIYPVVQRILFYGRAGRQHAEGEMDTIPFENELLDLDIHLINSRPYHSQTNGNFELFKTLETKVSRHDSLDDFM